MSCIEIGRTPIDWWWLLVLMTFARSTRATSSPQQMVCCAMYKTRVHRTSLYVGCGFWICCVFSLLRHATMLEICQSILESGCLEVVRVMCRSFLWQVQNYFKTLCLQALALWAWQPWCPRHHFWALGQPSVCQRFVFLVVAIFSLIQLLKDS